MPGASPEPIYFESPAEWRQWLAEHHATAGEVHVGFYKKHTGRQGMSWSEAVDEALCFGWIDTQVRHGDDDRHCQRFTQRKPRSTWSAVNIDKVERLIAEGRMADAGLKAYAARREESSRIYAFEQSDAQLRPRRSRACAPTRRRGRSGKPVRPAIARSRRGG